MENTISLFAFILIILGVGGLAGMTVLFPVLAFCLSPSLWSTAFRRYSPGFSGPTQAATRSIAILVSAHNEEKTILATLRSIRRAAGECLKWYPDLEVRILVGLDGCQDDTKKVVQAEGVRVLESLTCRGKWLTMQAMFDAEKNCDLISFVDSGVLWPRDLLCEVLKSFSNYRVMAVAPSYQPASRRRLSRSLWALERGLKYLESYAGGPVSMHGASMFFRSLELRTSMQSLGQVRWRNDDVVIPLHMRMSFPEKRISYLPNVRVLDQSSDFTASGRELPRRSRMTQGNLEWISALLPQVFYFNLSAALLSIRRVCRVFWAYWLLSFGAGFLLVLWETNVWVGSLALVSIILGLLVRGRSLQFGSQVQGLLDCARASFAAPLMFFRSAEREVSVWK